MLHLNPNDIKIIKAKEKFLSEMHNFISDRVNGLKSPTTKSEKNKIKDPIAVIDFFNNNIASDIDNILIGMPASIIFISNNINKTISSTSSESIKEDIQKGIKYIFNYTLFTVKEREYSAYSLASALDIRTCTYCNRNYTNTVINDKGKKITRPQFDHFFDKKRHPLLAISFFNLIPSCSICNSDIKNVKEVDLSYLHPYIDNEIDNIFFNYEYSVHTKSGYKINIDTNLLDKAKKTLELFALDVVYNSHTDVLQDLIKIQEHFSDKYLSILNKNVLAGLNVPKEEMYRIVFGTEYDSKDFVNRPLSKFKSDILKKLGII